MTSVAYGIAMPASRGVLTQAAPWWLPAGKVLFADIPNGRYWAAGQARTDFDSWLAAASGSFSGAAGRFYAASGNVIATAALNVARSANHVGGVPDLLYEGSGTNLFSYANDPSNIYWHASCSTAQNVAGPDGVSNNGWTLTATSTIAYYFAALSPGGQSAQSLYVKAGAAPIVFFENIDSGGQRISYFNASTGAWGTTNAVFSGAPSSTQTNFSVQALANGWYRIGFLNTGAITETIIGFADADGNRSVTSGRTFFVFGNQIEAAAAVSSYIPTASASATRPAESISGIVAPGNLTVTFDDNSTQVVSAAGFAAPATLNRTGIAKIAA